MQTAKHLRHPLRVQTFWARATIYSSHALRKDHRRHQPWFTKEVGGAASTRVVLVATLGTTYLERVSGDGLSPDDASFLGHLVDFTN